jgi:Ca-activated chloride channel family protein
LTYVELLTYESGNVTYTYPNNYLAIQSTALTQQNFQFTLTSSARTITAIQLLSHTATTSTNSGNLAVITYSKQAMAADKNYTVQYSLSLNQLGLFSMSTKIPDTLVPDKLGKGYFLFVAEPDPSANTKVINKVFTLIVDRSGSMAGTKIDQARGAANFIVQHLNTGDKFNIVDFSDVISSFSNGLVDYTAANQSAALTYIAGLNANGNTDIAGAFDRAIPEFAASATANTANIIIFLTDGLPTAGLTTSDGILQKIAADVAQVNKKISIFVFGIGGDVNQQLLSLIAQQNNGLAEYLGNDQLESRITGFYTKIKDPVLLKTQVAFSPDIITEVFPVPLPNLYKGQQLVFVGRYASAAQVSVTLSGETFDQPVSYGYQVQLADTAIDKNQFIMKIWAKQKIDDLLATFYTYAAGSAAANEFKSEITNISMQYGIASPFTSFTGGVTGAKELELKPVQKTVFQTSLSASCNKNGVVQLKFMANSSFNKTMAIRIFNSSGQLVKTLFIKVNGKGLYEVAWDGVLTSGQRAPLDVYFCVIDLGTAHVSAKLVYIRK